MRKILLMLFIAIASVQIYAQNQYLKNGIAVQGFDVVGYFESNKPVQGNSEINAEYNKAVYFFSSENNKALFLKNPANYAPQFGGYCAYGVSEDHLSPTDPQAFTIVNDKLYLNYNLKVKQLWSKDREERIVKANQNWETLKK